jgi:hypothetical protein
MTTAFVDAEGLDMLRCGIREVECDESGQKIRSRSTLH